MRAKYDKSGTKRKQPRSKSNGRRGKMGKKDATATSATRVSLTHGSGVASGL